MMDNVSFLADMVYVINCILVVLIMHAYLKRIRTMTYPIDVAAVYMAMVIYEMTHW